MSAVVVTKDSNPPRVQRRLGPAYMESLLICGLVSGCLGRHPQPPSIASKIVSEIKVTQLQFDGKDSQSGSLKKSMKQEMTILGSVEMPDKIPAANVIGVVCEWRVHASNTKGFRVHSCHFMNLEDRNLKNAVTANKLNFQGSIEAPESVGRFELCCGVFHSVPGTFDHSTSAFFRTVVDVDGK